MRASIVMFRLILVLVVAAALVPLATPAAQAAPGVPHFSVPPEDYQPYNGQTICDLTEKPGVVDFRALVLAAYPETGDSGIIDGDGCSGSQSEHKEGRAWDWRVSAATQGHIAADLLHWLLVERDGHAHALLRRLGIMYIIWNRQMFRAYRPWEGWQPYGGSNPHTDHVHFSFGWPGAWRQTTWWTGRGAPPPPPPPPFVGVAPVTAAAGGTGTVDVFWAGGFAELGHAWFNPGDQWRTDSLGSAPLGSRPSAVTTSPGVVDVFWKGTDGALWHRWHAGGWHGPQRLGMGPLGSGPRAVGRGDGSIDVFWIGTDFGLWQARYRPATGWTGPRQVPNTAPVGSEPDPVAFPDGTTEVFWAGTDGALWHSWTDTTGRWHGPARIPRTEPMASAPTAVAQPNGVRDVFWRGHDQALWHSWYVNGSWHGPESLGSAPMGSDPEAVTSSSGVIDVFWRGQDAHLWHRWYVGGSWHGPQTLGMGPLGSAPVATAQPNGTIDIFWKGTDNAAWHGWYVDGAWHGPQHLGGTIGTG